MIIERLEEVQVMNIGENIKKYRLLRGLTQKELGELIGKSTDSIKRYEDDSRQAPVNVIQDLAEVLEVPITDLLGLPERPASESIGLADLYHKQYELDELILSGVKGITDKELLLSRMVALTTEVAEYMNEEQSFKYWKKNKNCDRQAEIEEYVDILFFWLSIGNLKGYSPGEVEKAYIDKWNTNAKRQQEGY